MHGQHLPLADRGGRDAAPAARAGARGRDRGRQRGDGRLARRRPARPARHRGGAPARDRAGGVRPPGPAQRLRDVRPAARRRSREHPAAAGVRPRVPRSTGPRRPGSLLRRRRRLRGRARPRRGGLPRPAGGGPRGVSVEAAVAAAAGTEVTASRRAPGGSINEALRMELADGRRAFVKTRPDPRPGEYVAEAASLRWLAEPGAVRVPEVIAAGETFLAIEWIDPGRLDEPGEEALGRG